MMYGFSSEAVELLIAWKEIKDVSFFFFSFLQITFRGDFKTEIYPILSEI